MRKAVAVLFLAGVLSACPDPGPEPEVIDGSVVLEDGGLEPLVEVGTGNSRFEPLTDGQSLPIVLGPQGGQHLWTSVRARAPVDPRQVLVRVSIIKDGTPLETTEYRLNLVKTGSVYEWYGMTALVPDPTAVENQEVELRVELTDSANRQGADSRRVVPSFQ